MPGMSAKSREKEGRLWFDWDWVH